MSTFLNCDPLVSNLCTIGNYVIEWRLNSSSGSVVFVSGNAGNPDVDIQAFHPLVDEVVFAGTLYPVVRYIYINGSRVTSDYEIGALYAPDLIDCLSPVVVEAVDCSTVLGTNILYPYSLSYTNTIDVGVDKSRTIKYDISNDTTYLAWEFTPYLVSEQLEIFYCTSGGATETLVDNFVMGARNGSGAAFTSNLYPSSYPTNYRTYYMGSSGEVLKFITDISTFGYVAGDYLKIRITGSVWEPAITNTNWVIRLKCLTDADIDGAFYDTTISKITDTPAMVYIGDPSCNYNVTYNTTTAPGAQNKLTSPYFIYKYMQMLNNYVFTPVGNGNYTNPVNTGVRWSTTGSTQYIYQGSGPITCMNMAAGQTRTVVNNTTDCTFIYTDIADYNAAVNDISTIQATAAYTTWLTYDDSDVGYFAYYFIRHIYVASTCGDTQTVVNFNFHFATTLTYDSSTPGAYTIKFTHVIPTNNTPDIGDCDNTHDVVDQIVATLNVTKNYVFSIPAYATSHARAATSVAAITAYGSLTNETTRTQYSYFYIQDVLLNNIFDLSLLGGNPWFCLNPTTHEWRLYRSYDKLTLLQYATHEERLNCWKLERLVGLRTDDCTDLLALTFETVYTSPCITSTTTTTIIPSTTTTTTTL